eukprot:gene2734-3159_t
MMLEKEFNSGNSKVKVSHWACCKEMHEAGGFHYHCCLKLTGVKKWLSVKRDITKNHNIVVNFSDSHSHYIYAYRYVCKSDTEVAHSPGHPDLSEVGSPCTNASTAALREGSRKRRSASPSSQKCTSSKIKRRLSNLEVCDYVVENNIHNLQELFAKADSGKQEECGERAPDEYRALINYVSHNVYEFIEDCADYDSAILALKCVFVMTPNKIFARHLLATRRQKPGETFSEFLQELCRLSKDCNLKSVTAEQYREELANALDLAQKNAEAYGSATSVEIPCTTEKTALLVTLSAKAVAKRATMREFANQKGEQYLPSQLLALCSISAACPESLAQASLDVSISGNRLTAFIDSGSTDSYINESIANKLDLKVHPSAQNISMAQTSLKAHVIGHSFTDITIDGSTYPSVRLGILKGLCSDIILGQDFQ